MSFQPPGLIKSKGRFVRCKECLAPVGECEHTKGKLPEGFDVAVELLPGGPTIPAHVNRRGGMPVRIEVLKARPMGRPSGGILFADFTLGKGRRHGG